MPGTPADALPSVGFIARYLADAAKQRLPARSVAPVLLSYIERGMPADRIPAAVERARAGLPPALHPLLDEYAGQLGG